VLGGSSIAPKWVSASRSGCQPSTMPIEFSQISTSMSGGGVGGTISLAGRDLHRGDVADEGGAAVLVQVADVVGGVARGVGDAHAEHALATGSGRTLRSGTGTISPQSRSIASP
jgi:hypothetical protein